MATCLVTQMQGKQQLYIHFLYEWLVGQCDDVLQHEGSFCGHVTGTKGVVSLLIFANVFVFMVL